ncbi:hypothetical protein GCM10010260_02840 [Streptomyces filipinensis]|uniref:Uncharacterized protein n=1 Tax=Streptomyces filipinensis TaxID=66887 RepID=A0A918I6V7_9ACTN|nr:hypothetical protein GCM10010260_02840 [Streptomyces filipinensis]
MVSWRFPSPGIATGPVTGLVTLIAVAPEGQGGGGGVWHGVHPVGGFVEHAEHPDVGGFVAHDDEHPGVLLVEQVGHACAARGTAWAAADPAAIPNAMVAVRPAPTSPAPQLNRRDCVFVRPATRITSTPPQCLGT